MMALSRCPLVHGELHASSSLASRVDFHVEANQQSYRHKFWSHASNTEDLIFKVWAEPQGLDNSFDERFIRNLIGYQADCYKAKMAPSVFQLALISYDCATLATPPFWMPLWLLASVQYVLAYWVGGYLLGYVIPTGFCLSFSRSANVKFVIDTNHLILNITKSRKIRSRLEIEEVVEKSVSIQARRVIY
jgi:hypothetical protein